MLEDKITMLNCIEECPDTFISKEILFNVLKWNYGKINTIIKCLEDEELVEIHYLRGENRYCVSHKGKIFIEDYISVKKDNVKAKRQDNFKSIKLPIILMFVSIIISTFITIILNHFTE